MWICMCIFVKEYICINVHGYIILIFIYAEYLQIYRCIIYTYRCRIHIHMYRCIIYIDVKKYIYTMYMIYMHNRYKCICIYTYKIYVCIIFIYRCIVYLCICI